VLHNEPNATVITTIDRARFKEMLLDLLSRF
jgi:hypothetical protein